MLRLCPYPFAIKQIDMVIHREIKMTDISYAGL